MNKTRSKQLQKVIEKLALLKDQAEKIGEAEQAAFDDASEKVQESERGEKMEEAVRDIEEATNAIEEAMDALTRAQLDE